MENLTRMIQEALDFPESEVEIIKALGGMTNTNFLAVVAGNRYVVRFPGNGTEDFINRTEEKENLELTASLGINPQHIYFNTTNGLKITREIKSATALTKVTAKQEEVMQKVTDIFKKLHHSSIRMNNRFELFDLMKKYESLAIAANAKKIIGHKETKEDVMVLKAYYETLMVKECPSHIDPSYQNFILCGKGKLSLIDWEYSGMFDPLWDLASYSLESKLTESEEHQFFSYYFQREATDMELERILMHKIFQDYLWSVWTLFKEAKGDDFGDYGRNRFERAKSNIQRFKNTFDKREIEWGK